MKRKVLLITAVLILTLIFTGCAKSPKDELNNAFVKSNEINSQQTSLNINMNMDGGNLSNDPELQMAMSMFNNINMKIDSKIDEEKNESKIAMSIAGIMIEGEIFTDGEVVAIKYPLIGTMLGIGDKYMLASVEDMEQNNGQLQSIDSNEMIELSKVSREALLSQITEEEITVTKDVELETPEGSIKGTEYIINLPDKKTTGFLKQLIKNSLNNELLKDKTVQFLMQQALAMGNSITEEDINSNSDKVIDDTFKSENTDIIVDMKFILDNKDYIRGGNTSLELTTTDPDTQDKVKLTMSMNQKVWNINNELEFETPEFTEENSIQMDEMENGIMNNGLAPISPGF